MAFAFYSARLGDSASTAQRQRRSAKGRSTRSSPIPSTGVNKSGPVEPSIRYSEELSVISIYRLSESNTVDGAYMNLRALHDQFNTPDTHYHCSS